MTGSSRVVDRAVGETEIARRLRPGPSPTHRVLASLTEPHLA